MNSIQYYLLVKYMNILLLHVPKHVDLPPAHLQEELQSISVKCNFYIFV